MTPLSYVLLMAAIAAIALGGMWIAWRGRAKRDARLVPPNTALSGDTVVTFSQVMYVSTTPINVPLQRLAIPNLSYRGLADLDVRRDGVTISVNGESPVSISREHVLAAAAASSRVGKAVETGGMGVLQWRLHTSEVESGFRFASPADQQLFISTVRDLVDQQPLNPIQEQQ